MKAIAIAAHKGGCSKSTTCWALASVLSRCHRVLVIDMDPQGTVTAALTTWHGLSIYEVLSRGAPVADAVGACLPAYEDNLRLIPASPLLAGLDVETASRFDRHHVFADVLAEVVGFDYVLIDCPSAQGINTIGAICAAQFCLTPCSTDDASFEQVPKFKATIDLVSRRLNPSLVWLPIVASMHDARTAMDRAVLAALREQYQVFGQVIPRRTGIRTQMAMQQPCSAPEFSTLTDQILEEIRRHDEDKVRSAPKGSSRRPPPRQRTRP